MGMPVWLLLLPVLGGLRPDVSASTGPGGTA
jgi:hypothetical protein